MKKGIFVFSATLTAVMLITSIAIAGEETVFSGNVRLSYVNMKDTDEAEFEDKFSLHCVEIKAQKQVGSMGVFINHRIGDENVNYLYEGWASWKAPSELGTFKLGLVPVPFGIFQNGLYYPKGIPYDKGWMWNYDYGVCYENIFKLGGTAGLNVSAAYLDRENSAGELGAFAGPDCACLGQRDIISGRLGVDLSVPNAMSVKVGGSVQTSKLLREAPMEDDTKLGIAGDVTVSLNAPIPVSLLGEFINYSLSDDDTMKGNIMMGQLDITPIQNIGMLNKAILSPHFGMRSPTEGDSTINFILQLRLIMCKQFNIFAQVFADKVGDEDLSNQGLRVWFMYVF